MLAHPRVGSSNSSSSSSLLLRGSLVKQLVDSLTTDTGVNFGTDPLLLGPDLQSIHEGDCELVEDAIDIRALAPLECHSIDAIVVGGNEAEVEKYRVDEVVGKEECVWILLFLRG